MDEKKLEDALETMRNKIHEGAMFVVGNSKDITALQEWQVRQNGTLVEINESLKNIQMDIIEMKVKGIGEIKIELAKGKPSWATLIIISGLLSLAVGSIVYALRLVSLAP